MVCGSAVIGNKKEMRAATGNEIVMDSPAEEVVLALGSLAQDQVSHPITALQRLMKEEQAIEKLHIAQAPIIPVDTARSDALCGALRWVVVK